MEGERLGPGSVYKDSGRRRRRAYGRKSGKREKKSRNSQIKNKESEGEGGGTDQYRGLDLVCILHSECRSTH